MKAAHMKAAHMKYGRLGRGGPEVSRICLGMMSFGNPDPRHGSWRAWHVGDDAAAVIVRTAVDGGLNFFDTADSYAGGASEEVTGTLLRRFFARREDYVLATKVYFPTGPGPFDRGLSRRHIMAAIDASLRRLGTDYVDLYQVHRWDYGVPIAETMAALRDVVRAGKARYLGASSMHAGQFAAAQQAADAGGGPRFAAMQNHYNLLYREEEREMIPLCAGQGVAVLPYSPLARGVLAGTRHQGGGGETVRSGSDPLGARRQVTADFGIVDEVRAVATARGVAPAQVAVAWLLGRPAVTSVVLGATKPGHVSDALGAVPLALTAAQTGRLEARYQPQPIQGHE
jgi:aryl-alcohol dehydrogenase-like predicted oxidoreductase